MKQVNKENKVKELFVLGQDIEKIILFNKNTNISIIFNIQFFFHK